MMDKIQWQSKEPRCNFEWIAHLTEKVGLLSQAVSRAYYCDGSWADARDKAIEVATLALKIAETVSST